MSVPIPASTNLGVFVLGMHRSGTSAVASVLHRLGFYPGSELLPPQDDNPQGYFEDRRIVDLNNHFLEQHGRPWSDPRPLQGTIFSSGIATDHRRAIDQLGGDFLSHEKWLIKDPRLCRLLPLWQPWINRSQARIAFLHVVRSPESVARSLQRREGFGMNKGLLLWLRHALESERETRGLPRSFVVFDEIVEHGGTVLRSGIERLGTVPADTCLAIEREFPSAFQAELVHHRPNRRDPEREHPWSQRVWRALVGLSRAETVEDQAELDSVATEISAMDRLIFEDSSLWETELQHDRFQLLSNRVERTNLMMQELLERLAEQALC